MRGIGSVSTILNNLGSTVGSLLSGLYNNPLWNAPNLQVLRINGASLNSDDESPEIVNFNGTPCWVGLSVNQFQGRSVFCKISGNNTEIVNTYPNGDDNPSLLTAVGTNLYFIASDGTDVQVYQWNGSSVSVVSGLVYSDPKSLRAAGTTLYFNATPFGGGARDSLYR